MFWLWISPRGKECEVHKDGERYTLIDVRGNVYTQYWNQKSFENRSGNLIPLAEEAILEPFYVNQHCEETWEYHRVEGATYMAFNPQDESKYFYSDSIIRSWLNHNYIVGIDHGSEYKSLRDPMQLDVQKKCTCPAENFSWNAIGCQCGGV